MSEATIFDKKIDFWLFVGLPLALIFFLVLNNEVSISLALFLIAIDQLHVYLTYIQSQFWSRLKQNISQFRKAVLACLIAGIATYILYFQYGIIGFFMFIKYLTIFHFARQQYGWLRIIQTKMNAPFFPAKVSEWSLQIFCLVPILIGHSNVYYFTWYPGLPNLFTIPDVFAQALLTVYGIACICYLVYEIYLHLSGRIAPNLTRLSILLFTFVGWNQVILGPAHLDYERIFFFAGHHVLSYIFLLYYFNVVKAQQKRQHFWRNVILIVSLFIFIVMLRNGIPGIDAATFSGFQIQFSEQNYKIFSYFVPFLWLLSIFHFILDGFIWKNAFRPERY